ncbi:MAG: hypothetical protein JWM05_2750 [Acidimicrobiales bacterium]|nr:hypothetical protein [Acidimicrobiales bacterium]
MTLAASISSDLFVIGIPLLDKVIRTVAVYGGLLVLLRLGGKRDLAQLNSFDLVVLLLLSNVVQNAIIGPDNSLLGGVLGAGVLVGINAVVVRFATRTEQMDRLFEGTPTTLVRDGQVDRTAVRRLGLRESAVITALRRQGANTVAEVAEATLEPGGAIVVQLREEAENATKADVARVEQKLDALLGRLGGEPRPAAP